MALSPPLWYSPRSSARSGEAVRAPRKADQPEERIACDVVLMAVGQVVDSKSFAQAGVPTDHNNIVTADDGSVPGLEGVFSGGDCVSGPATVILAIEAGKVAAASIDEYLGFHTDISANLDIPPAPSASNTPPAGWTSPSGRPTGGKTTLSSWKTACPSRRWPRSAADVSAVTTTVTRASKEGG